MGTAALPSSSNTAVPGAVSLDLFFWAGFDVTFRDVEGGHCAVFKQTLYPHGSWRPHIRIS